MQPSCGMVFIFLLVRLQWNIGNTEGIDVNEPNGGSSSIRDNNQFTVLPASQSFALPLTTAINPSATSRAVPLTANDKENIKRRRRMRRQPHSTYLTSTDGTTVSSSVTTVPKDGINNSATNFNGIPMSLVTFTTTGDFSAAVTKSAVATSASTGTPSNSMVTHSTPLAAGVPGDNSSINPTTLSPTSITSTSPTVTQDSPTSSFNPTQKTTDLNHNFSSSSTTSPNPTDPNKDETNKEGVIAGVIIGTIVVFLLIGLIGYFICHKKRSESFSHRRLYDNTRNDPVLHLDNSLGPYNTSLGGASGNKSSPADTAEDTTAGCPSNDIPMADMTPSPPSVLDP
ncbi:mucin-15 [Patagioenas fasciata]|uniref:mucin-15 n=1 Tax=Patagioenas fasciata TaxID=372321 RepID=UPI0032E92B8F